MNEYDSENARPFVSGGATHTHTHNPEDADLLVTILVLLEKRPRKIFHQIGRWKKLKDKKSQTKNCNWRLCGKPRGKRLRKKSTRS